MSWPEAYAFVGGVLAFAFFIAVLAGAVRIDIAWKKSDKK